MRAQLDNTHSSIRRSYVRLLVDRVTVGEEQIEIRGSKAALLSAVSVPDEIDAGAVPSSIPKWRCRESSANPSLTDSLLNRVNTGNFLVSGRFRRDWR